MKPIKYFLIIFIIVMLNIFVRNISNQNYSIHNNISQQHSIHYKTAQGALTVPTNLYIYANNTNITTTKSILLGISSVISTTDFYIVLNTQGVWAFLVGSGEVRMNFTFEGQTQIVLLSRDDFLESQGNFKQIILSYHNITLDPTSKMYINMTLDVTTYLYLQYAFTFYIKSMDLFFIETPLINPIVIPSWQYGEISTQGTNLILNANTLDYIVFLPSHSDINITVTTTAPILIKKVNIDNAIWVNLPNLTLSNKNFIFNFITDDSADLQPRDLTLYYSATTSLPLNITISAEVVIFKVINPINELNQDQTNLRLIIAIIITLIPVTNLMKNRKKKLKGVKI